MKLLSVIIWLAKFTVPSVTPYGKQIPEPGIQDSKIVFNLYSGLTYEIFRHLDKSKNCRAYEELPCKNYAAKIYALVWLTTLFQLGTGRHCFRLMILTFQFRLFFPLYKLIYIARILLKVWKSIAFFYDTFFSSNLIV